MVIWKWQIAVINHQTVMMPDGAKILDVQIQGGQPCIWALCDEAARKIPRYIAIYGTGNPMPDDPGEYIATFQMQIGVLIFHVFEFTGQKP